MTKNDIEKAANEFLKLRNQLERNYPEAIREAERLAASIADPSTATAGECWAKIWDKPLYANCRVLVAERRKAILTSYMTDNWHELADLNGQYAITKGKGTSKSAYKLAGDLAQELNEEAGIPRHRLYAIICAARAFTLRSQRNAPFSELANAELKTLVPALRKELGFGWGNVTVLHFLTDMGLAIKPDLHVIRTMTYLGFSLANKNCTNANFEELLKINDVAKNIIQLIKGNSDGASLREVDYLMMQISNRGIIPSL